MSVALGIQHAMRMRRIMLSYMACLHKAIPLRAWTGRYDSSGLRLPEFLALPYLFTLSHFTVRFSEKIGF